MLEGAGHVGAELVACGHGLIVLSDVAQGVLDLLGKGGDLVLLPDLISRPEVPVVLHRGWHAMRYGRPPGVCWVPSPPHLAICWDDELSDDEKRAAVDTLFTITIYPGPAGR